MQGQYDKWYFYSESPERRSAYSRYIDQIAEAARRFCRDQGFFPVLLGMEKMDAGPCENVLQKLDGPCAVFPSGEYSADIMTGILQKLDALVTSRYHAAVLSMANGCPIVAVSMDERLESLMKENGLDGDYLHHVADGDLLDGVLHSLKKGYERRVELKEHIHKQHRIYRETQQDMGVFLKEYIQDTLK